MKTNNEKSCKHHYHFLKETTVSYHFYCTKCLHIEQIKNKMPASPPPLGPSVKSGLHWTHQPF